MYIFQVGYLKTDRELLPANAVIFKAIYYSKLWFIKYYCLQLTYRGYTGNT